MMRKILVSLFGVVLMTQVYASAPAAKILLKANQQMVDITLAANATTGYQWFVQNYDHDLLSLQNYRYVPNPNKTGKVGVGGVAVFSFAVDPRFYDAPQTTTVSFVYQQPWNPGQNASVVQVALSATASSNDLSNWQKYPQLAGPAAEVQASEADIYAQDQGQAKPMAMPSPLVALPGSNNQAATPAATTSATATAMVDVNAATRSKSASQPVLMNNSEQMNNMSPPPPSNNQVMPTGEPTPDTNSQSQWLSLPANSSQATTTTQTSGAVAAKGATPAVTTSNNNSTN